MIGRIARGVGIALRSGAAPLLVGARLAGRRTGTAAGVPHAPWSLALASKMALDEIFFATELASVAVLTMDDTGEVASAAAMAMMIFYTNVGARTLHAALGRWLERRTQAWRRGAV